jgi:hypothetical protein
MFAAFSPLYQIVQSPSNPAAHPKKTCLSVSVSRKLLSRTLPKTSPPNQCTASRAGSQSEAVFTRMF